MGNLALASWADDRDLNPLPEASLPTAHRDSFINGDNILRIRGGVAQLGRAAGSYTDPSRSVEIPAGQGFESLHPRHRHFEAAPVLSSGMSPRSLASATVKSSTFTLT